MAMTPREIIAVVQHFDAGGEVQVKSINPHITRWEDADCPLWDFVNQAYRPKPKPLELWVNVYDDKEYRTHESKERALKSSSGACLRTVHMREVIDD